MILTPESAANLAHATEAEPVPLADRWGIAVADQHGRRAVLHTDCPGWVPAPAMWHDEAEALDWLRTQRPDLAPHPPAPGM